MGLPTWDKPALACLSSRIPHGTPISLQALTQVDRAEAFLRRLGVRQVRVRHHGQTASIEVEPDDFDLVRLKESEINAHLGALGFTEVVLDLAGYRTGSLDPRAALS
jgi:pyridinium-3,5-biscarboxylic acid mononucleotide sulfurtransferase